MIKTILRSLSGNHVSAYLIRKEETESAELYFIKKELDMRRLKHLVSYEVTVYRDFEKDGKKMRGFCTSKLFPQMNAQQVDKAIAGAYYAASFAANPYFDLPKGVKRGHVEMPGKLTGMSPMEMAQAFAQSLYAADNRSDAWINTSEFFASRRTVSIRNSEGIDVSYTGCKVSGEFIVQCGEPQDVEQYQDFAYIDLDTEALTAQAGEALEAAAARARAVQAPEKGEYDVILSGKELRELFSFYAARANAQMIYPGYSQYQKGTKVQGDTVAGEKINMTLKALAPYSEEGIPMKELELIRDGELKAVYGNARFSAYLGIEPTGYYEAYRVDNGSVAMEELKSKPYLHVVSFSAFETDAYSGYFGGEIRLAYLYDGDTVTPVTGGSVSGNLLRQQGEMIFSKERYKDCYYDGPMAVRLHKVAVSGK